MFMSHYVSKQQQENTNPQKTQTQNREKTQTLPVFTNMSRNISLFSTCLERDVEFKFSL